MPRGSSALEAQFTVTKVATMSRIFAMLPTYNESENIGPLLDAILALSPEMEALVVDDNSPDGTWRLVGERAKIEPRVHLLHRTRDKGRGLAGIAPVIQSRPRCPDGRVNCREPSP